MNNKVIRRKLNKLVDAMKGWCKFTFWICLMLLIVRFPIGCAVPGAVGGLKFIVCFVLTGPFIASCEGVEVEVVE